GHGAAPVAVEEPIAEPQPAPEPADPTVVLPPVPARTAELDLAQLAAAPPPAAPPPAAPPPAAPPPAAPPPAVPPPAEHALAAEPPAPAAMAAGRSSATPRRALAVLGGAAALVLVGAAAVAGLRSGGGDTAGSAASRTTSAGDVAPVDPSTVRAAASSTQDPDGGVTYGAANTLDGKPQTAWNSDGRGVGASLTYTFDEPVDLRSLTVRNGYQKTLRTSGGATVDLFALNQRVRTFTVVTDSGRVSWDLRDDRAPQTLTHDFGRTRTVRLEVAAVYPSAKYRDLAVSDVTFGAAE
ncbi:MAG TPA: hypothetical protein VEV65_04995, partial [Kineosporiaceae bacterium]|nr:hypothetical protein [Kineosporiaceae bacterium]